MQTLTQSFQTTIEESTNNYQYGYFITFVRRQYSKHKVTKQEVMQKIKRIMSNKDIEIYIFKGVNIGDSKHFATIHYHCIVLSTKKPFVNAISLNRISKDSKTTINMKNIYNVTGVLGYIQDKHKILKIFTNNKLLKASLKTIRQKIVRKPNLYFSFIIIKIKRGRCYTPT